MYLIFIIEFIILSVITYKMTISERILKVLKDRNMTQVGFAKQVGIATSTISEWKKKKTNPAADKIMNICNVLQITPEQLLTGKGIEDEEETGGLYGGFEEDRKPGEHIDLKSQFATSRITSLFEGQEGGRRIFKMNILLFELSLIQIVMTG